jgi:hypothetical protein
MWFGLDCRDFVGFGDINCVANASTIYVSSIVYSVIFDLQPILYDSDSVALVNECRVFADSFGAYSIVQRYL